MTNDDHYGPWGIFQCWYYYLYLAVMILNVHTHRADGVIVIVLWLSLLVDRFFIWAPGAGKVMALILLDIIRLILTHSSLSIFTRLRLCKCFLFQFVYVYTHCILALLTSCCTMYLLICLLSVNMRERKREGGRETKRETKRDIG